MAQKCRQQSDLLTESEMRMIADGIIRENMGAGEMIDRQQRLVTSNRSREMLRARTFAEGNLLECVF